MPVAVLKKLESIRQKFFWGGSDENRKVAWVKWDRDLNKKVSGGLNIGSLKASNWGLLGKWWPRGRWWNWSMWEVAGYHKNW